MGPLQRNAVSRAARALSSLYRLRGIRQFGRSRAASWRVSRILSGESNLKELTEFVLENAVPVRQPLILISQAERSGGSLLSQLFDNHPEIAAHPHEIKLGYPNDAQWVPLDPTFGAKRNFFMLFEDKTAERMRFGYTKGKRDPNRHAFYFLPALQYRLFRHLFEQLPPDSPRDVLNHFFTSYFNAWLNYQGDLKTKRWVSAFAPRIANSEDSVASFFSIYPDGRLVQIIRDPKTWFHSAKNHKDRKGKSASSTMILDKWRRSAQAIVRNKSNNPNGVIVLRFEDLLERTEPTMRGLSAELGIAYDPVLLEPTHNGNVMAANSSFDVRAAGVINAPLHRQAQLSEDERRYLESVALPLYEQVTSLAFSARV